MSFYLIFIFNKNLLEETKSFMRDLDRRLRYKGSESCGGVVLILFHSYPTGNAASVMNTFGTGLFL